MEVPPVRQATDAVVHQLRRHPPVPRPSSEQVSLEDAIAELGERTALQALASAYSDRLGLIRADADAEELMASSALIATLERTCLSQH